MTVIWDYSLSRNGKHEKEVELLRSYLNTLPGSAEINLIGFSNTAEKLGTFKASDTEGIISKIKSLNYDGGTHYSSLHHSLKYTQKSDLILLFSDGIANWGHYR